MLKMQPDNHQANFRLNITTDKKYLPEPEKNGFIVQNALLHMFCKIAFYIFFVTKCEPSGDQWDHSKTNKYDWIRLCAG